MNTNTGVQTLELKHRDLTNRDTLRIVINRDYEPNSSCLQFSRLLWTSWWASQVT